MLKLLEDVIVVIEPGHPAGIEPGVYCGECAMALGALGGSAPN